MSLPHHLDADRFVSLRGRRAEYTLHIPPAADQTLNPIVAVVERRRRCEFRNGRSAVRGVEMHSSIRANFAARDSSKIARVIKPSTNRALRSSRTLAISSIVCRCSRSSIASRSSTENFANSQASSSAAATTSAGDGSRLTPALLPVRSIRLRFQFTLSRPFQPSMETNFFSELVERDSRQQRHKSSISSALQRSSCEARQRSCGTPIEGCLPDRTAAPSLPADAFAQARATDVHIHHRARQPQLVHRP